jgi:hypothetical protein
VSSSGEHAEPIVISSMIPGLMKMSILTVGEMLAMFPSSKAFGAGIGLLNKSICLDGITSLVLIAHMEPFLRVSKASCKRKRTLGWSAFHGKLGIVSFSRIYSS